MQTEEEKSEQGKETKRKKKYYSELTSGLHGKSNAWEENEGDFPHAGTVEIKNEN